MTQQSGSSKVRHVCIRYEIANMRETSMIGWKMFLFFIESFFVERKSQQFHVSNGLNIQII